MKRASGWCSDRTTRKRAGVRYALIRLDPGDAILTGGCGWVLAQYAGLGAGPDGTIGVRQYIDGWSHPLIVGVDVGPGCRRP